MSPNLINRYICSFETLPPSRKPQNTNDYANLYAIAPHLNVSPNFKTSPNPESRQIHPTSKPINFVLSLQTLINLIRPRHALEIHANMPSRDKDITHAMELTRFNPSRDPEQPVSAIMRWQNDQFFHRVIGVLLTGWYETGIVPSRDLNYPIIQRTKWKLRAPLPSREHDHNHGIAKTHIFLSRDPRITHATEIHPNMPTRDPNTLMLQRTRWQNDQFFHRMIEASLTRWHDTGFIPSRDRNFHIIQRTRWKLPASLPSREHDHNHGIAKTHIFPSREHARPHYSGISALRIHVPSCALVLSVPPRASTAARCSAMPLP